MRSPLEILAGRYEHALLTTYSFNLRFFEEWVLKALWASEVSNVVVLVDPDQLGHALADHAPSAAGRAYHLVPCRAAQGVFHPKLILVSGRAGSRLCVSSANLTADGQMRNVEMAIAFDAALEGHAEPIRDAAALFRELAADLPAHTAAAVQKALAALPEAGEESPYRVLHNRSSALIESFPEVGSSTAVTPFVDAAGEAAARVRERGPLKVFVDGNTIAAAPEFFEGPWEVEPRAYQARLHGKAYDVATADGHWILVGSPNLTAPALLRSADSGNLEAAVAFRSDAALDLPPSERWSGEDLAAIAGARLAAVHQDRQARSDQPSPLAFDAWENEGQIRVSGIRDGTSLERLAGERWLEFGTVVEGAVLIADPTLRPTRLRAILPGNRLAYAVVHQPDRLRSRMRAPTSGRHAEAADRLPLDVETVRILEEALGQLYALSELVGEAGSPPPRRRSSSNDDIDKPESLIEWMPRSPEEEPRVPPLYRKAWQGEPDALLALIGRVLRLELDETDRESEVGRERLGLDDLEEVTGEDEVGPDSGTEPDPPPPVERAELERYRRAFAKLFDRGIGFIGTSADPTVAGWAFTYLLRLVEDLGSHSVKVHGYEELLVERPQLRAVALDLLERYLDREEADLLCLATARGHLASLVRDRSRLTLLDRERVDRLAFHWGADLVAVPNDVPGPTRREIGLDSVDAALWLEQYARRSRWGDIEREVSFRLEDGRLQHQPFPILIGDSPFKDRLRSPAWELLAFAAPAGHALRRPFAVVVDNLDSVSALAIHALLCVPGEHLLVEAWLRSGDRRWVVRSYAAPTQAAIERAAGGPTQLDVIEMSTEHDAFPSAPHPVAALSFLLDTRAAV